MHGFSLPIQSQCINLNILKEIIIRILLLKLLKLCMCVRVWSLVHRLDLISILVSSLSMRCVILGTRLYWVNASMSIHVFMCVCVCARARACVYVWHYDFYSFIISPDPVLGWTQGSVEGEEGSEAITLSLGYFKGTGPDFNASIVTSGAAGKAYVYIGHILHC